MQAADHLDQSTPPPGSGHEVPSELLIDLQRPPMHYPPLAIAVGELALLLGLHHEQRAIAGGANLDCVVWSEPKTVPARKVMKPAVRELELFRGASQRNHHGTDIEVLHDPSPARAIRP